MTLQLQVNTTEGRGSVLMLTDRTVAGGDLGSGICDVCELCVDSTLYVFHWAEISQRSAETAPPRAVFAGPCDENTADSWGQENRNGFFSAARSLTILFLVVLL